VTTFIDPATTRIVLPCVLAVGYAGCHWWRWRMMHPKIDLDKLPPPATTVIPVAEKPTKARAAKAERRPAEQPAAAVAEMPEVPPQDGGTARIGDYREAQEEAMRLDFEAFDVDTLTTFLRRARFRPEYYVRLGECAWYRGAMVEAHFWLSIAMYRGVEGLDAWLDLVRRRWLTAGRPNEEENEYLLFPTRRGELARALLNYVSRLGGKVNHDIIVGLAQEGDRDAQFILARIG